MAEPLAQAAITGVSPASLVQGESAAVQITGSKTTFGGSSIVSFSSPGLTASGLSAVSATVLTGMVAVDGGAQVGPTDVTVTTGGEIATGSGLLTVQPLPATVFCSPNSAMRGTTETVQVNGSNTHFDDASVVSFAGAGITVTAVTVFNPAMLRVTFTIDPDADLGTSHVEVTTGAEVATGGQFTVEINPALMKINSVSPGSTTQGTTDLPVIITGQLTHFDATSVVSFAGAGVAIKAYSLVSETVMNATLDIDQSAALGSSDVTVTTGAETAHGTDVFTVVGSTAKAEVLREAVNTYLRQNHIADPIAVDICEQFIANVNEALRQAGSLSTGVLVTVGAEAAARHDAPSGEHHNTAAPRRHRRDQS